MLIEFSEKIMTPTGVVECTDLTDIDRAVGSLFMRVVHSMVVSDTDRKENKEFATFVMRKPTKKLYIGTYDTHEEFIQDLVSKTGTDDVEARNNILPVFYMSRDPSITFANGADYIDVPKAHELQDENGNTYAVLNKSFAKLTYTINALAWNKSTLSRMGLGLSMWFRHIKSGRKHTFKAKTKIANCEIDLNVSIDIPKDLIGTASSLPFNEKRLNALTFTAEIVAEVYEAEEVEAKNLNYFVGETEHYE